jgi:hypothetical protein
LKTTKSNTVASQSSQVVRIPWPPDDRIRWVEWRVRKLTVRKGHYVDERGKWLLEEKAAGGQKLALGDTTADYAVWLLKVRDGLSWHQLAYRFFPSATEHELEKYESRVRRAFARVERNHPGSEVYVPPRLSEREKLLLDALTLGVIPVYVSNPPDLREDDDEPSLETERSAH